MFCRRCGAHVNPGAKFCKQCGTQVTISQSAPQAIAKSNHGPAAPKSSATNEPAIIPGGPPKTATDLPPHTTTAPAARSATAPRPEHGSPTAISKSKNPALLWGAVAALGLIIATGVFFLFRAPRQISSAQGSQAVDNQTKSARGAASVLRGGPAFAEDANGHPPLFYLPVTLVNNQNSATPENFQGLVTVNSSAFNTYEAANLSNINFQLGDGRTILYSWLESGETNTSTSTIYWVVLPQSLAGSGGTLTVYMVFYGTPQNSKDSRITGTAPSWAGGAYGQFDNGSNVFEYYQSFGGLQSGSVPNGWRRSPANVTVANQPYSTNFTFTDTTFQGAVYATSTPASVVTYPTVIEARAAFPTGGAGDSQAGYAQLIGDFDPTEMIGTWGGTAMIGCGRANSGADFFWGSGSGGHFPYVETSRPTDAEIHVFTLNIDRDSLNGVLLDYNLNLGTSRLSPQPTHAFGVYGGASATGNGKVNLYWIRTRSYPPSAGFPSVIFGNVSVVRHS